MSRVEAFKDGRVLLLNPPMADTEDAERMDLITCVEPFGLLRLGTHFRQRGCQVRLLDCLRHPALGRNGPRRHVRRRAPCGGPEEGRHKEIHHFGLDREQLAAALEEHDPDLIVVSAVFTWHVEAVREALGVCKAVHPGAHLVVGGNLPTLSPDALDGCAADEVYQGDLPGAAFLPTALDLMEGTPRSDYLRMIKGCPHRCSYCVTGCLNDGQVQARAPEEVFAELQQKLALGQTRVFTFFDDYVMYKQRQYLDVLLDLVIQERPRAILQFPLGFSAHMLTEPLVRRMREAGVETMILALETISEQRSRDMQRPHHLDELRRAVDLLKDHGYSGRDLRVFYLVGLPNQTLDEVLRAILFLLDLGIAPSLTTYALAPGSQDWQRLRRAVPHDTLGDLAPGLWRFAHPAMPSDALDRVYAYFHEQFFPLERIRASSTDDPVIGTMQRLLRQGAHRPEAWS